MPFNQDGLLVDDQQPQVDPQMQPAGSTLAPPSQAMARTALDLPMSMQPRGMPPAPGPPKVPADPDKRLDLARNLLYDFIWSLGAGASASAAAPPGQRSRAAFGAALSGPTLRRKSERELALKEAEQKKLEGSIQLLFDKLDLERQKVPIYVSEAMSKIGLREKQGEAATAKAGLTTEQASTESATRAGKVKALDVKNLMDLTSALSKEIVHVKTPDGGEKIFNLFDLINDGGEIRPLTETGSDIQITIPQQMADSLGQPELAGRQVNMKIGQQLANMATSAIKTTATAKGVLSRNMLTGEVENLGAPAGVATAMARPTQVIVNGMPQLVPAGEAMRTGAVPGNLSDVNRITGQSAAFSNLHSNVNELMRLSDVVGKPGSATRISLAMSQPASTIGQYLQGVFQKGELSQEEYQFINALATLREDMFNMRMFFPSSIRSDRTVSLMLNQVPDVSDIATGQPAKIREKLSNWIRSVHAVEAKYGPLMDLIKPGAAPTTTSGSAGGIGNQRSTAAPPNSTMPKPEAQPDYIMQGGRIIKNPNKK